MLQSTAERVGVVQVAYALSNFPLELLPQGEFHLGGCGLPGSQGLTDEQCDTPHRQHLLHPNQTASLNPWCLVGQAADGAAV